MRQLSFHLIDRILKIFQETASMGAIHLGVVELKRNRKNIAK